MGAPIVPSTDVPLHLLEQLRAELLPGERMIWSAQPVEREFAHHLDSVTRFGRMFTGFAVFWVLVATGGMILGNKMGWTSNSGGPSAPPHIAFQIGFPASGLLFVAPGAYLASRRTRAARAARHTAYAITNQRILVLEGDPTGTSRTMFRFLPDDLARATRVERAGGVGDIVFKSESTGFAINESTVMRPRGLLAIERVAEVDQMLRATLFKP